MSLRTSDWSVILWLMKKSHSREVLKYLCSTPLSRILPNFSSAEWYMRMRYSALAIWYSALWKYCLALGLL